MKLFLTELSVCSHVCAHSACICAHQFLLALRASPPPSREEERERVECTQTMRADPCAQILVDGRYF